MSKNGWMGHMLAGTIATEWVRQDPDAALAWANSLPENQRQGAGTANRAPAAAPKERLKESYPTWNDADQHDSKHHSQRHTVGQRIRPPETLPETTNFSQDQPCIPARKH